MPDSFHVGITNIPEHMACEKKQPMKFYDDFIKGLSPYRRLERLALPEIAHGQKQGDPVLRRNVERLSEW